MRHGDSLVGGGRRLGAELLSLPDPPTAIISGSDEQAYGVYLAARDHGLRIPEDLSVVGNDDVDLCQWISPQLTTVRQPLAAMAREATRMVIELARGGVRPNPRVELATSVVVRASTAPPRTLASATEPAAPRHGAGRIDSHGEPGMTPPPGPTIRAADGTELPWLRPLGRHRR